MLDSRSAFGDAGCARSAARAGSSADCASADPPSNTDSNEPSAIDASKGTPPLSSNASTPRLPLSSSSSVNLAPSRTSSRWSAEIPVSEPSCTDAWIDTPPSSCPPPDDDATLSAILAMLDSRSAFGDGNCLLVAGCGSVSDSGTGSGAGTSAGTGAGFGAGSGAGSIVVDNVDCPNLTDDNSIALSVEPPAIEASSGSPPLSSHASTPKLPLSSSSSSRYATCSKSLSNTDASCGIPPLASKTSTSTSVPLSPALKLEPRAALVEETRLFWALASLSVPLSPALRPSSSKASADGVFGASCCFDAASAGTDLRIPLCCKLGLSGWKEPSVGISDAMLAILA